MTRNRSRFKNQTGAWTLIELLITISIIGIIIAFFAPPIVSRITMNAKIGATRKEMYQLRLAVVGNPELVAGGEYSDLGFYGDVGRYPRHLIELVTSRPDTTNFVYPGREAIKEWDPYSKHGWHGPYVRDDADHGFLNDAWETPYRINTDNLGTATGISSAGPDGRWFGTAGVTENDDITVLF
jgi:prepilin-type N-terminal cleavage/methylation domain-containing protein